MADRIVRQCLSAISDEFELLRELVRDEVQRKVRLAIGETETRSSSEPMHKPSKPQFSPALVASLIQPFDPEKSETGANFFISKLEMFSKSYGWSEEETVGDIKRKCYAIPISATELVVLPLIQ